MAIACAASTVNPRGLTLPVATGSKGVVDVHGRRRGGLGDGRGRGRHKPRSEQGRAECRALSYHVPLVHPPPEPVHDRAMFDPSKVTVNTSVVTGWLTVIV